MQSLLNDVQNNVGHVSGVAAQRSRRRLLHRVLCYLSERFASRSHASASGLYSRPTARPNESGTKNFAIKFL